MFLLKPIVVGLLAAAVVLFAPLWVNVVFFIAMTLDFITPPRRG
jgi:hypothetical protein